MAKLFVSNEDRTERLFKSNFIEFFSKVHWTVPLIIYIPIILYLLYYSVFETQITLPVIFLLFISGIFTWTVLEYFLHRFIFHYHPKSEWGKRINFIFHGVHHAYPKDSLRLVMPPSVSIPLGIFFYFIFLYILGPIYVIPFFPGVLTGYLAYDTTHFAIHHFAIKSKFWKFIKDYHMKHHYKDDKLGYGVSQPLWDYIFGTRFKD